MIEKKYILTKFFIVIGFFEVFATPQIPDKLIYKGDTLSVFLYLPNEFYKIDTVGIDSFEVEKQNENSLEDTSDITIDLGVYINKILSVKLFGDKKNMYINCLW